jgi:CRP-like cAMP-binding protein
MSNDADLRATVSRVPGLSMLGPDERALLAKLARVTALAGGERLIDEGAAVPSVWILVEGRCAVEAGAGPARALIATREAGALLGEGSYLSGRPATASVTALGECRLLEISQARLRTACEEQPDVGLRIERLLTGIFAERLSGSVGRGSQVRIPRVDAAALASLRAVRLQPVEREAVARYARCGERDPFLWSWCARALELTTLPCVPAERLQEARATKFLAAVALVIVDDVADRGRSPGELAEILALVGDGPAPDGARSVGAPFRDELAWIWSVLAARVGRLPSYRSLARVLEFDWRMVFTANRHARLARDAPAVLNPTESMEYAPHGIALLVFATLDLMSSPPLDLDDLRATRELVHAGQSLCELANMLATWRREVPDRDFSSRIFALGLARRSFTSEELCDLAPNAIVDRIDRAGLEDLLLAEWRTYRARAEAAAARIHGFEPSALLAGYDAVFGLTLAARGSI